VHWWKRPNKQKKESCREKYIEREERNGHEDYFAKNIKTCRALPAVSRSLPETARTNEPPSRDPLYRDIDGEQYDDDGTGNYCKEFEVRSLTLELSGGCRCERHATATDPQASA